jgi:hypothetical protein
MKFTKNLLIATTIVLLFNIIYSASNPNNFNKRTIIKAKTKNGQENNTQINPNAPIALNTTINSSDPNAPTALNPTINHHDPNAPTALNPTINSTDPNAPTALNSTHPNVSTDISESYTSNFECPEGLIFDATLGKCRNGQELETLIVAHPTKTKTKMPNFDMLAPQTVDHLCNNTNDAYLKYQTPTNSTKRMKKIK